MEISLLPATVGGVGYPYKVSHQSLSTNAATRHLVLYSLSSSMKLKKFEILLSLIVHLKSKGLHPAVRPPRSRTQKSLHLIALSPADLLGKGESLL